MFRQKELNYMLYSYIFSIVFIMCVRIYELLDQENDFTKCFIDYKSDVIARINARQGKGSLFLVKMHTNRNNAKLKYCILNSWSVAHVVLYSVIGYFCPSLFWLTFFIGVSYEIIEYYTFDCHNIFDIFYNSLGFGFGYFIKKIKR